MKIKTSELTGAALAYAVKLSEGGDPQSHDMALHLHRFLSRRVKPDADWSQGGPIIERERIWLQPEIGKDGCGNAWYAVSLLNTDAYGPTPLIAAMRCYVASKLGDEVEIPEELK